MEALLSTDAFRRILDPFLKTRFPAYFLNRPSFHKEMYRAVQKEWLEVSKPKNPLGKLIAKVRDKKCEQRAVNGITYIVYYFDNIVKAK